MCLCVAGKLSCPLKFTCTHDLQACARQSAQCVPLYDSLGEDAIGYIVEHASCNIVFTSALKFSALVDALPKLKNLVHTVVFWGEADQLSVEVRINAIAIAPNQ